jgi:hypothetical protein
MKNQAPSQDRAGWSQAAPRGELEARQAGAGCEHDRSAPVQAREDRPRAAPSSRPLRRGSRRRSLRLRSEPRGEHAGRRSSVTLRRLISPLEGRCPARGLFGLVVGVVDHSRPAGRRFNRHVPSASRSLPPNRRASAGASSGAKPVSRRGWGGGRRTRRARSSGTRARSSTICGGRGFGISSGPACRSRS